MTLCRGDGIALLFEVASKPENYCHATFDISLQKHQIDVAIINP